MPYEVETFDALPIQVQHELSDIWRGPVERALTEDHGTYDLHLIARQTSTRRTSKGHIVGWAAIRFAPDRLSADVSVAPGRGALERTDFLVDALRVLSDGRMSIEWWSRGNSALAARRVANIKCLPQLRKIIRMERNVAPVTSDLKVRAFRFDDAPDVVRVNNAAFADHPDQFDMTETKLHRELDRHHTSRSDLLLVHVNGELAGFIWTLPRNQHLGELHVLAVSPKFQGRGLGGKLLDAGVVHLTQSYNIPVTFLYVGSTNKNAIAMYERHGFFDAKTPLISYLA